MLTLRQVPAEPLRTVSNPQSCKEDLGSLKEHVLKTVRMRQKHRGIPCLLTTRSLQLRFHNQCRGKGVTQYIQELLLRLKSKQKTFANVAVAPADAELEPCQKAKPNQ